MKSLVVSLSFVIVVVRYIEIFLINSDYKYNRDRGEFLNKKFESDKDNNNF